MKILKLNTVILLVAGSSLLVSSYALLGQCYFRKQEDKCSESIQMGALQACTAGEANQCYHEYTQDYAYSCAYEDVGAHANECGSDACEPCAYTPTINYRNGECVPAGTTSANPPPPAGFQPPNHDYCWNTGQQFQQKSGEACDDAYLSGEECGNCD